MGNRESFRSSSKGKPKRKKVQRKLRKKVCVLLPVTHPNDEKVATLRFFGIKHRPERRVTQKPGKFKVLWGGKCDNQSSLRKNPPLTGGGGPEERSRSWGNPVLLGGRGFPQPTRSEKSTLVPGMRRRSGGETGNHIVSRNSTTTRMLAQYI